MKKILFISFITFIIDFISKMIVKSNLILYKQIAVIDNFLYLTYTNNYGAAFSILKNSKIFLIIIGLIILIYLVLYIKKHEPKKVIEIIAYGLLIGGILGNLYDRVFYGYVIDFLDFYIFGYDFAIFNIADSFIVIAIILLFINTILGGDGNEDNYSRRK